MKKTRRNRKRKKKSKPETIKTKQKNIFFWPLLLSIGFGGVTGLLGLLESPGGAIKIGILGMLFGLVGGFAIPYFDNAPRHNISEDEPADDGLHRLHPSPYYTPRTGFRFKTKKKRKKK